MADCKNCKYRQFLANAYDMHIDHTDCDKVNTFFCEKMQKPDTTVIIDAGCTDKTMYHKGFKDGYEAVEVVQCKDCKYWDADHGVCDLHTEVNGVWMGADDFCSKGGRKDNG